MEQLYRLVYTSFRNDECDDAEIKNILAACERNNPKGEITGVLLHTDRRFIQVVEGPLNTVNDLYDRIKDDPRHGGINKRFLGPIDKRDFPDWYMGYVDISSKDLEFNSDISDEHKAIYRKMVDGDESSYGDNGISVLQMFVKRI